MKTKLTLTLALFITMFSVVSHAQTGDILAPEKSPTPPPIQYPTLDALLAATKNGKIPEQIKDDHQWDAVGCSVVAILCQQLHINPKDVPYDATSDYGIMLANLTSYELNNHDERSGQIYKTWHETFAGGMKQAKLPQFVTAFDTLAKQYISAVDDYIALKKARENQQNAAAASQQAAQETQETAAKAAMEAAAKARQQKLADVLVSNDYKRWQSALKIEEGEKMIKTAKNVLGSDNGASEGADLAAKKSAQEQMDAGKILVDGAFSDYQKLGGTAKTPEEVQAGEDPALPYR